MHPNAFRQSDRRRDCRPPALVPALLAALASGALVGCTGDWPGHALQGLAEVISPAPSGVTAAAGAALAPPQALRLELAGDGLGGLDFLALSGCELQATHGRRSSSLGSRARDSQKLLLDLEFLRLAPACIDLQRERGNRALADTLQQAWGLKRRQLPAAIYNATLGSDEYREFWERPAHALPAEPTGAAGGAIASLAAINNQVRHWLAGDFRADNREFEILLWEVAAGEGGAPLQALATGPADAVSDRCDHPLLVPILELEHQLAAVLPPAYREWRGRRQNGGSYFFADGLSPETPCQRFTSPVSSPNRSRILPTL